MILSTKDLTVGYNKIPTIQNINFNVEEGEIVCLLGPNGAGKTTLIRTLSGLLYPIEGSIYINDKNVIGIKKDVLAKIISVVLTEKPTFDLMTVFEVVSLGRYPHTGFFGAISKEDETKIETVLKNVGAFNLINRYFQALSDGEKQKVMLARALVQEPKLIILDEPTTHLDINHKIELLNTLKDLSRKMKLTVVLSLHEIDLALKYCDKLLLIRDKKVLSFGTPEATINNTNINNVYNIKNAAFNTLTSSIELKNFMHNNIFVVGGGGVGTPIYRVLTKYNLGFSTGILHENDIDYETAKTMSVKIQSEKPFDNITDTSFKNALKMIDDADVIIDSGFPTGEINNKNLELLNYASKKHKKIITFRKNSKYDAILCSNIDDLIKYILKVII
ncbi:ABC transporter ATP-binding protein [Clostridium felsineum]|uniref:ABC transporter ATP-binding protein n=1 Tax=Clostridium felsineum TaxID=36839 RepID=UPI0009D16BBA|nr:ABC transporter ATP-binding protein [Clostridium felsineum]URZ17026.1 Vitamin B12 import ATP-binding protein BtuD [Clostridium felsineum DSM 794]